jgi:hypothetical protein
MRHPERHLFNWREVKENFGIGLQACRLHRPLSLCAENFQIFRNFDAPFPEEKVRDHKCKLLRHVSGPKRRVMLNSSRVTVAGGSL